MQNVVAAWLALALLLVPCRIHAQEEKSRDLFAKAYVFFSQGDSRPAEELFLRTVDHGFILEDYSLHYLGLLAVKGGDLDAARQYFSRLQLKFPESVWAADADLQLAKFALAEKNYARAAELFRNLRARRAIREIADEAAYLLGQALEAAGDSKPAYAAYQDLRRASPLSAWDAPARKAVAALREKFPDLFGRATTEATLAEAELLGREQAYGDAVKLYRKLLEQTPQGNGRPRILAALGNLFRAERKREEAIPVLGEIVESFADSPEAPAALQQLAQIYWNRDDDAKALEYFNRLKERYPISSGADYAELASAKIYESAGKTDDALAAYQNLSKRAADAATREEAGWRAAWIYYLRRDDADANAAFKRLAASKDAAKYRLAALYWQARAAARLEQNDEAKRLFLVVLNDAEESYYKTVAAGWLARMGVAVEEKKPADPVASTIAPPALGAAQSFHLSRAEELNALALGAWAAAELDEIKNLGADDLSLRFFLMREYARAGAYARSVALATQIPLSRAAEELARYRYPLAYWDAVQKLAREDALDPYLIVALIRQESLFDPKAISPAAAHGLMQLLPSTAARVASRIGLGAPQREKLFDPELNLKLGIHHLKELLQRYSNNPVKAVAAYNAGENAVARWEARFGAVDDDEFIERISYPETQLYVKLVLRNLRVYRNLYGEQK
jgi:soluble lytic murein transglycosylase